MRLAAALALVAVLGFGVGCVQSPTGPALIYMDVKGPLGPGGGTSTAKRGEACAWTFLALFAGGDASIEMAKRTSGISEVTTLDHHSTNVLGFGKFCTIIYGR